MEEGRETTGFFIYMGGRGGRKRARLKDAFDLSTFSTPSFSEALSLFLLSFSRLPFESGNERAITGACRSLSKVYYEKKNIKEGGGVVG